SLKLYVGAVNTDSKTSEIAIITDAIPLSDEGSISIGRIDGNIVSLSKGVVSDEVLASGDSISVSGSSIEYTMSYDGTDIGPEDRINITMTHQTSVTLPIQGAGEQTFAGHSISLSAEEGSFEISGVTSGSLVYLPGTNRLFVRLASGNYTEATGSDAGQFFATAGTANVVLTNEGDMQYVVFQEHSGSVAGDPRFSDGGRTSYLVIASDGASFQYPVAYDSGAVTSNDTPTVVSVGHTTQNCSVLTSFTPETVTLSMTDGVCTATVQMTVNVCD
ncbi:MAG: hypothetical protein ABID61_01600, partial [Candidatus Micrarchaeota archaeon]